MPNTLRTKLILLTLPVIVGVLFLSTLLSLFFSQRVLKTRAWEDALLLSRTVALHTHAVLRSAGWETLAQDISALRREHPYAAAIEVFFFADAGTEVVSSRPETPVTPLTAEEWQAVREGRLLSVLTSGGEEQIVNVLTRIENADTENRGLVARLSCFNEELEVRVAQATHDLARRNEDLLRLQREMGRVEPLAALGRITGTIAHELETPLNSVLGHAQLLAREELSESACHRLRVIESQVQRMVATIQFYLSHTRGSPRPHQPVELNTLVRETLGLLAPFFQQHRVQVVSALADALPRLSADAGSLQRVLINLLNNAVDAMEAGGAVTVATRETVPPETTQPGILLEVKDTGTGIPPELLSKIFALFVTTKALGKGSGLGLAICQEIVQAHGGAIEIFSRMGMGSHVRVFFPTQARARNAALTEGEG